MKKLLGLMAAAAACLSAQTIDLSSLDKLDSKASEKQTVVLDGKQIELAAQMMVAASHGKRGKNEELDEAKGLLSHLQFLAVRHYEFAKKGQYLDADLDAVRNQISKLKGCSRIIDSKEKDEHSEVFLCTENDKPSGLAVIDAEQKELSVVLIKGPLDLNGLGKLGGAMGLPSVDLMVGH